MAEDIEIRIGDEIRDELPIEQPNLPPGKHRAWGNPERDSVRVILGQRAYEQCNAHAQSEPHHEVGGVMLGKAYRHEGVFHVDVTETIRAPMTNAGAAHVTFTSDTWSAINREKEHRFPDLNIVGWYHTHPRMSIFVSGDDVFLHGNFFSQNWQVALVLEPHKHLAGFFVWKDGVLSAANGFYELFDAAPKSVITWRNQSTLPSTPATTPTSMRSPWSPIALAVVVGLFLLIGLLLFQTRSAADQTQAQLVDLQTTVQAVNRQVDQVSGVIAQATDAARQTTEAQTAVALATAQAIQNSQATATAVAAARTATAEASETTIAATAIHETQIAVAVQATDSARVTQTAVAASVPTVGTATAGQGASTVASEVATPSVAMTPNPAATRTPAPTPATAAANVTLFGDGLSITQNKQPIAPGDPVIAGSPVTFTISLRNAGSAAVTITGLRIALTHDGKPVVPLNVKLDAPLELAANKTQRFPVAYQFTDPGDYIAVVQVRSVEATDFAPVQDASGKPGRIPFTVTP